MQSIQEIEQIPELKRKSYTIKAQKTYYDKVKNDPILKAKRNAKIYAAKKRREERKAKETKEETKEKELNNNVDMIKQLLKDGKISIDELKLLQ